MEKIKLYTCSSGIRLLNDKLSFRAFEIDDRDVVDGDIAILVNSDDIEKTDFSDSVYDVVRFNSVEILG
ncbi:hypothetical protein PQE75_gp050 [Bacillus phage vB_BcoS-136]|uniref:Uncharacterized protein n=1 Tax=Bacillus phage vB_BcoS-136 TaxID=2419619 RepID=A0A3G3BVA4_9CAUD|nr:hypothetical protein PQE75_gp050 [Bacillus phage vB_BcoS-136]AYP68182.1 hypothetical protein vBBcoS136_00050 [Bacillus phage vB_BcoS-136]